MDNTGVYTVDRNNKPALTATLDDATFTVTNEVPLALLEDKVKANGEYLPLEAIKAKKGGLSFEIDKEYLTAGDNEIDLSEVKDVLGTAISGETTFTITKELVEKNVPSTIDVSYNDKKGTNTVTSRFFAVIDTLDYAKAGFEVTTTVDEEEYVWDIELNEVYGEVTVNDVVYSSEGKYLVTAAIGDVPADFDGDFEVRAYTVDFEGVKAYID